MFETHRDGLVVGSEREIHVLTLRMTKKKRMNLITFQIECSKLQ